MVKKLMDNLVKKMIVNRDNMMKICLDKIKKDSLPVVLFGAAQCGVRYLTILQKYNIEVLCFCDDDPKKSGKYLNGIKVIRLNELKEIKKDYNILISSYGPYKLIPRLKEEGVYSKYIFTEFYLWEDGLDYYQYYMDNLNKLEKVYNMLADEKSKTAFFALLNYKVSRDISLIENINEGDLNQYFDSEIIKLTDSETFVDLGAYDGDTVFKFINKMEHANKTYKKIFAFEPDKDSFEKLKKNTAGHVNVDCLPIGAYDQKKTLNFAAEGFWTSSIDVNGNVKIEADTLDHLMKEKVTFIKADIEGAEISALKGAENIIKKYKPRLAFCIYHKKEDIFEIPLLIHSMNPKYKFYMRQYSGIPVESVLYAVDEI